MNASIERLISLLERENVEWELYWEIGRGGSFRIERERLERSQRKFYSGIGLRVGYRGRLGFSYITGLNHDGRTLEEFVKRAVKLAKVSEVPFKGFPTPSQISWVDDLYDGRIDDIPFEEAHSLAEEFADKMRELKRGSMTLSGSMALGVNSYGVANSNGILLEERSTGMSVSVYAVVDEPKPGSGYSYQSYSSLQTIGELEMHVTSAMDEAQMSSRAEKLESFNGRLILEPSAFRAIVEIFLENLYGDNVYFGRSRFSSVGEEVASEKLTLADDSTLPGLPGSYSFDGEGTPGGRKFLVEKGTVKHFLLDHTYASFLGMKSTGNAIRDFRSVPHIGASNLVVESGRDDLEECDGVVVKRVFGEHTANPVSGDFSLTVELGYVVKNGELKPFRDNMLVGNVFSLLRSIETVGKKVHRVGAFLSPRIVASARLV